jgi:preprotein translocase subunit SecF
MINFIKKRRLWYSCSALLMGIGVWFMLSNFMSINHIFNLGIDFTGGTSVSIRFDQPVSNIEQQLRPLLVDMGLEKHSIQITNSDDVIIKTKEMDSDVRNQLFEQITNMIMPFELMEVDFIGPSIGDQLRNTSLLIVLCVMVTILLYCSWRFEFIFGLASIAALLHDLIILFCVTAIAKIEVNTAYVAALLTVLGYSINDTIVIFDRIRENLNKDEGSDEEETLSKSLVNESVNAMVPRSIHTSITTGLVVFAIFLFGGVSLNVFSTVLIVGLITGTYSSLFIASPMIITISKWRGVTIVK